jgi:hypothetical protein
MPTINQIKQLAEADTPLLFFQCVLPSGVVQYWSTHTIPFAGNTYSARVLKHNLFDLQLSADDAMDGVSKLSLTLANADSALSELNANGGFRGTQVTVYFAFADLASLTVTSESTVLFRGVAGDPDQIGEDFLQLTFANKLSLQRIPVPEVRIQRSCGWNFPATAAQRQEALDGGSKFSRFYRCGYSADLANGVGNLNGGQVFAACDKSRAQCVQRGMFSKDSSGNATARFGGFEFVPSAIQVRTSGDKTTHLSPLIDNTAKYNDAVPIVYGTGWLKSPVVFARNDGNLTHMETLLGLGPIDSVIKVVVEDVEIPLAVSGQDMSATGWYSVINSGSRQGAFNGDFADSTGPLGDPHGSIASLSVVVPNRISTGKASPNVEVLMRGIQVDTFDSDGSAQATLFSNNPAWVILDVLRRCGWTLADLNLKSFAASAAFCQTLITATDLSGKQTQAPRYSCNLRLTKRQSAATVVRGIRVASSLMLRYGVSGLLELLPESTLAVQQSMLPDGGNSVEILNNGWPAYEFSDASAQFSGIARDAQGRSSVVLISNTVAETSNRLSVEFQDEFNEYQQDSLSIVDSGDVGLIGYEIASQSTATGITNYSQATRVLLRQLDKSTKGNLYINFVTSFRALKIRPGDIIAVTYRKEGLTRTPFRVTKLSPSMNFQFVTILAQVHDDAWYSDNPATLLGSGRQPATHTQVPRPLLGLVPRKDSQGEIVTFDFSVTETIHSQADGVATDTLSVGFSVPNAPSLTSLTVPLLSLSPTYSTAGGTLEGGNSYYYAVSAFDQAGGEGALSFTASIHLPAGPNTYAVTLHELSFPATSTAFNVYRGASPQLLYRIASNATLADTFSDAGLLPILPIGPPDASFDHANFYYRYEYAGPFATTAATASSITSADMGATPAAYNGFTVRISDGMGQGQERSISKNTQTTLTVTPPWSILPNSSSTFVIVEASWRFASISDTSPAVFEIPYTKRSVIEISGRSANVANQESSADLCPITRWALGNANPDAGLAGPPDFTLGAFGGGNLTLQQVGFAAPANTSSVTSCTLQLFQWNELLTPSPFVLASNVDAAASAIHLNHVATPYAGQAMQIGTEIVTFLSLNADGSYGVSRAALGSTATAHSAGDVVLLLDTSVIVAPFASNFFDNKASANYIHTVRLPDVRIVAAEMLATNALGPSQTTQKSYAYQNADEALRTLSGGQLSLQVSGYLATQQNAAPPLVVEARHAIRDLRATLTQPAKGYAISVQVLQNGLPYASPLTILSGSSSSASMIKGANLPPLIEGSLLTLDIALALLNPSATDNSPGRDLTVTIRL